MGFTMYDSVLVAGTHSGCGKTTITCALLAAIKERGTDLTTFKCGPDYIDPMFHRAVLGTPSWNLDPYFMDAQSLRTHFFSRASRDGFTIIESAMGYFDGIGWTSKYSSAHIAHILDIPVILVVDVSGCANSIAPVIEGFVQHEKKIFNKALIKGLIFNGAYAPGYSHYRKIAEAAGLVSFGYFVRNKNCGIKSRHLGLVTANEDSELQNKIAMLREQAKQTIDLEKLLERVVAPEAQGLGTRDQGLGTHSESPRLPENYSDNQKNSQKAQVPSPKSPTHNQQTGVLGGLPPRRGGSGEPEVRNEGETSPLESNIAGTNNISPAISGSHLKSQVPSPKSQVPILAVARDEAFCFTYTETLELFESIGCNVVFFSPMRDGKLPDNISGLYLPGGYPELHTAELSANKNMLHDIKEKIEGGIPTIAECGGFLYLHKTLDEVPLAGVINAAAYKTEHLVRFGYTEITATKDNVLSAAGDTMRVHEFHYWDSDKCGDDFIALKAGSNVRYQCIYADDTLFAGFPHLYLAAYPEHARHFVEKMIQYQQYQHNQYNRDNGGYHG